MAAVIETRSLSKSFGPLRAVENVSIAVKEGHVLGLLGTNGAGKTTMIKILATLLKPTSGDALVGGISVFGDTVELRRRLGYLPETPSLYEHLTGREFLRFVGGLRDEKDPDARAEELIDMFGLQDHADAPVGTYSKGLKQRIAFAQAILHRPRALLLDEPILGLDPRYSKFVKDFIKDFASKGGAVLITTHLTDMAEAICTEIAIIHKGVIQAMGTLDEVKAKTGTDSLEAAFISLVEEK